MECRLINGPLVGWTLRCPSTDDTIHVARTKHGGVVLASDAVADLTQDQHVYTRLKGNDYIIKEPNHG